ncbi:MAG: hypothetical protein L6R35_002599 [Caloplaca aegaea]|nr:MAG: hypothetical protein L6R35_002599 [Caloplaca aegaea]
MRVQAVGQLCSTASMSHNLTQCRGLMQKAVAAGAKALFLPEASDYIAPSTSETISLARPASSSPFVLGLQASAKEHRLPVNVGIHEPVRDDGKKVKNTLIWIDECGEIKQRYQKLHLFDVDVSGGPVLKESDGVEKGTEIVPPFQTAVGQVGMLICFDPSAFTPSTGIAHWSTLLRARAIETQSYIIAAAQVGAHNEKRTSYGHSMIVSPWGDVLAELGGAKRDEPEIAIANIDLAGLQKIRREMPLLRRTDVYAEI